MKHQKNTNSLNEENVFKFMARKLNIVNDQSHGKYDETNKIICNLQDDNDDYILVRGAVTIAVDWSNI